MEDKIINTIASDIADYLMQVKPEQFREDYEDRQDAIDWWTNSIKEDANYATFGFAGEVTDMQPDILDNWNNFYTCKNPREILKDLKQIRNKQYNITDKEQPPVEDLSERGQKIKEVKLMDQACRSFNDEDYVDIWLSEGVPDGASEEDYEYYADDEEEFKRIRDLFVSLTKSATKDESGFFNCNEEAFKYAKQYAPKIKNSTYKDGKVIVTEDIIEEDCTQAGAIAGPTGMFGIKPQKKIKKEESESTDIKTILTNLDVSTFEELKDEIEELFDNGEIDDYYDDFMDIISTNEDNCEDYIRRRTEVTNTDWKDELGIEEDNVTATIEELVGMLKENKKVCGKKLNESTEIEDKIQMEIYELIQNGRKLDNQDIETNIQKTKEAIAEEYPELDAEDYIRTKALEIYNGEYDETNLPTEEIYGLISNGMFAGQDLQVNIDETVNEILNDYGTDYTEQEVREYVTQKAQEIYANELDENKEIKTENPATAVITAAAVGAVADAVADRIHNVLGGNTNESKDLKTEGLYNDCYKINDKDTLKEIALNSIYVANNDEQIIKELEDRLTNEEKEEWKEDLAGINNNIYGYIANNYTNMPLELLREIALNAVYVADNDEAIQKEIAERQ